MLLAFLAGAFLEARTAAAALGSAAADMIISVADDEEEEVEEKDDLVILVDRVALTLSNRELVESLPEQVLAAAAEVFVVPEEGEFSGTLTL